MFFLLCLALAVTASFFPHESVDSSGRSFSIYSDFESPEFGNFTITGIAAEHMERLQLRMDESCALLFILRGAGMTAEYIGYLQSMPRTSHNGVISMDVMLSQYFQPFKFSEMVNISYLSYKLPCNREDLAAAENGECESFKVCPWRTEYDDINQWMDARLEAFYWMAIMYEHTL